MRNTDSIDSQWRLPRHHNYQQNFRKVLSLVCHYDNSLGRNRDTCLSLTR